MNRYRIDTGRYGGELTIGKITQEFLEFYQNHDDPDELIAYLDDPQDESTPFANGEYHNSWFEFSDIMHLSGPYADNDYSVWRLDEEGNEVEEVGRYDYDILYGQECYVSEDNDQKEAYDGTPLEWTPTLSCHSSEKGGFGSIELELEGEFDPEKFAVSIVESNLCSLVNSYYYDGEELEVNWDWADSMGKAFYSEVGYANQYIESHYNEQTQKWLEESVREHFEQEAE